MGKITALIQSGVANKRPLPADMDTKQLGMNTADGILFIKKVNTDGSEELVEFKPEALTSISLTNHSLTYTDENGDDTSLDLSGYVDPAAATVVSGVVAANTGIITFTKSDATTFDVDGSSFIDTMPSVPTALSELTNDSGFITDSDIPEVPSDVKDLTDITGLLTHTDTTGLATETFVNNAVANVQTSSDGTSTSMSVDSSVIEVRGPDVNTTETIDGYPKYRAYRLQRTGNGTNTQIEQIELIGSNGVDITSPQTVVSTSSVYNSGNFIGQKTIDDSYESDYVGAYANTGWASSGGAANDYISFLLGSEEELHKVRVFPTTDTWGFPEFEVFGSNNTTNGTNGTWISLASFTNNIAGQWNDNNMPTISVDITTTIPGEVINSYDLSDMETRITQNAEAAAASSSSGLISSAIHTLLADEIHTIASGGGHVFNHVSDPHKMRSVFVEKEVLGAVESVDILQVQDISSNYTIDGYSSSYNSTHPTKISHERLFENGCSIRELSLFSLDAHEFNFVIADTDTMTIVYVSPTQHHTGSGEEWFTIDFDIPDTGNYCPGVDDHLVPTEYYIPGESRRSSGSGAQVGGGMVSVIYDFSAPMINYKAVLPITAQGETILDNNTPMLSTASVTQTDLVANGAETALSFDGGATWGAFSADHGTVAVPEGSAAMKVKVDIGKSLQSASSFGAQGIKVIDSGLVAGDTVTFFYTCETLSGDEVWSFFFDGRDSNNNLEVDPLACISNADNSLSFYNCDIKIDGEQQTSGTFSFVVGVTYKIEVTLENDMPNYTLGARYEIENGSYSVISGTINSTSFTSITFDKQTVSSWLLDNENHWDVEMTSATTTSVVNVSTEDKSARIRIGATGLMKYDYTKTIPAESSEVITLPVDHGGDALVHLKQFVPGGEVSKTKWDFDVTDGAFWDGGNVDGGVVKLSGTLDSVISTAGDADFLSEIGAITEGSANQGVNLEFYLSGSVKTSWGGFRGIHGGAPGSVDPFLLDAGAGRKFRIGNLPYNGSPALPQVSTCPFTVHGSDDNISWDLLGELTELATSSGEIVMSAEYRYVKITPNGGRSMDGLWMFLRQDNSTTALDLWDLSILGFAYNTPLTVTSLSPVNTTIAESINSITATDAKPTGTDARYAISFDGKTTWRTNGNAVVTLAELSASGMTSAELAAFDFSGVTLGDTLDVAIALSTTNNSATPSVDQITVDMTTQGAFKHTVPMIGTGIEVSEVGTNQILLENKTGTEVTVKASVEV